MHIYIGYMYISISIIIIGIVKMNVDNDNVPIPDGQILGLMASNNGRSCSHHHCCGSTVKVGSVVSFNWCTVLDEVLQELEDAIQMTMGCDLNPENKVKGRCRVGYISRRIAHDIFEASNYVHRTTVVIEQLKDSY